jgi:hypothetical protein
MLRGLRFAVKMLRDVRFAVKMLRDVRSAVKMLRDVRSAVKMLRGLRFAMLHRSRVPSPRFAMPDSPIVEDSKCRAILVRLESLH